jgi:hypothetical protein
MARPNALAIVKSTSEQLVAIVKSADSSPDKRQKQQQAIDATVDVDDIAHFCIGRLGRLATP